jgi:DNA repair exonuclease SbcCD nuclease subunit
MKIAILTDTHIGARNDSQIFNDYFLDFIEKQFIPYLLENNINTVFHAGDLFDRRKFVNFHILHTWNKKFFDVLQKNNITMHIITGNHDVYYKNTNKINSIRELLQKKYANLHIYDESTQELKYDNAHFLFVPWLNQENSESFVQNIENSEANICIGHFDIIGFEMFRGSINYDHGLKPETFMKFDKVLTGHYHHKSQKDNIYYLGTPYEIIASDYNDPRGFHVIDTETCNLEFIQNPRRMFRKIKYDDTGITLTQISSSDFSRFHKTLVKITIMKKTSDDLFEQFISKLREAEPYDIIVVDQMIDNLEDYDEMIQTKDTRTILREFVQSLKLQNENEVIEVLDNLYVEALNTDITEL